MILQDRRTSYAGEKKQVAGKKVYNAFKKKTITRVCLFALEVLMYHVVGLPSINAVWNPGG